MLISLALLLIGGIFLGRLVQKIGFPALVGMLLVGLVLGPHALGWLDQDLLDHSALLRQLALLVILLRAGLALHPSDLRKMGRPALLLCFVPATFEIVGITLLGPPLLGLSVLESALLGAVLGAVSPAVIVPQMLRLLETGYGTAKKIPQMLLAGSSLDDIYVLVLFTTFLRGVEAHTLSAGAFAKVPVALVTGILSGILSGIALAWVLRRVKLRDTQKALLLLSVALVLTALETVLGGDALRNAIGFPIPFSGLLAVLTTGLVVNKRDEELARRMSAKLDRVWVAAEIFLFVLVGAAVDFHQAWNAGRVVLLLLFGGLAFRMVGVLCCVVCTSLTARERLFCMISYCPKATVQAAIGGVALSMGLSCGPIVLAVSVVAILVTAPLGAFGIRMTYKRCLEREPKAVPPTSESAPGLASSPSPELLSAVPGGAVPMEVTGEGE